MSHQSAPAYNLNLLSASAGKPCIRESADQTRHTHYVRHSVTEALMTAQLTSRMAEEEDPLTMCGNVFTQLKKTIIMNMIVQK